jgi:pimeloyl-ACP methyl ester carboxylesterase
MINYGSKIIMKTQRPTTRTSFKRIGLSILALVLIITSSLFIPWNVRALSSHPHPVQGYEEAVQRLDLLKAKRAAEMNPDCHLQFLNHGRKVDKVIILVHGYTNCPAQFGELGQKFYSLGYNVLIAPLPHHGLANRLNDEQSQLTADELTVYADNMLDIAHGLGDHVTMMGISGGGVITAWAAQNRSDLDTAVIISPAFGYQQIPTWFTAPTMNIVRILPDSFEWWDPNLKENTGPAHAYPRYSKHALAEILRLGFAVQVEGLWNAPGAHRLIVITNANDTSVNNEMTANVVKRWEKHNANIETYEFLDRLELPHDMIDPEQFGQRVDIVYPQLIDLVNK